MIWKGSLIVVVGLASIASGGPQNPLVVSVCDITRNPMAHNGKVVRFRAAVLTDWHHGIVLFVKGCRGGIQLASTDTAPAAETRALDLAIGTPLNGGHHRTAMATFTGLSDQQNRNWSCDWAALVSVSHPFPVICVGQDICLKPLSMCQLRLSATYSSNAAANRSRMDWR